ncbi:preprotein translocase subunit SecY [Haloferula sp. BvORR071]|uniref:preprotein translocase subunit SecY n=1 Tax=Haloferula sp. BvORR071 TaxID=1396141 RepID=UPI0005525B42|nr:preprotein translocase subunit SecY [Haloferula sp. BvORR071]
MISAFANTWKVPELRDRILFTLAMIIIVRLGVHITLPGVDAGVIEKWMDHASKQDGGNAFGAMLTIFAGGGLQHAGIFALGIMPYISASIMVQLMTAVVPKLARLAREDNGRQKITQYTRYITIAIAVVQGYFAARALANPEMLFYMKGIDDEKTFGTLVPSPDMIWYATTVITVVAGTLLLMWIGDQMTERGIGNGTSIIISVNIISALPGALVQTWKFFVTGDNADTFKSIMLVIMIAMLILVIAGTIAITQAQRRIAVQYAKRVVGRKQFGGQTQYLPLKVNYAGVMPIIFATAILSLPTMMITWFAKGAPWAVKLQTQLNPGGTWYYVLGAIFIFFFSYFWVATMFQPSQISEDLKRNGGYIPGVRPGKPTADFLDFTMTRLTFAGAIFLTLIFILPATVSHLVKLPPGSMIIQFFGGTSLLILVGVVLDVMRQVETHLLQRHYDGFLRKGKIKGRYDRLAQTGNAASSTALVYLWAVIGLIVVVAAAAWVAK